MMKNFQLSLPGPTEYDPLVLQELMRPNLPHYGDLWMAFYRQCLDYLQRIYRTKNSVYILPCSGSGAVEATFASLGAKKGLFLNNGTFGQRILSIGQRHLKKAVQIEKAPGVAFIPEETERQIKKGAFDLLVVVHGETSTGMVNHLETLSEICRTNDMLLIVDAISTLGGVPLSIDELGIDFCVSASQKALGALPGLATLSVSERGWEAMPEENEIHSWYLNLKTWRQYEKEWGDWHPYPMTLPVHLFAGGVGPLRKRLFRIGHMGYSAQDWLINRVISGISMFLK